MAEGAPYPQCKPGFLDELSLECWLGVEGSTAHAEYQGGMGCGWSQPTLKHTAEEKGVDSQGVQGVRTQ